MTTVLINYDDESKARALKAGFREQTVLVRDDIGKDSDAERDRITSETMREIGPFRFVVAPAWGKCAG